jgi:hypothetical protein
MTMEVIEHTDVFARLKFWNEWVALSRARN